VVVAKMTDQVVQAAVEKAADQRLPVPALQILVAVAVVAITQVEQLVAQMAVQELSF
jgi:hypothetical protein